MDTQSLNFHPSVRPAEIVAPSKISKKDKKFLKKQRKARNTGSVWEPIDRRNSITLHLVHRSTNDPLLGIPDEHHGEWVLEPEVNSRTDFERVQQFFHSHELEDTIPHQYRSDEFIEKTSAKSMPILPSQCFQSRGAHPRMDSILECYADCTNDGTGDGYDYEQHYRFMNEANLMTSDAQQKTGANTKKLRLKDGVQVLEQYLFEEDYDDDDDDDDDAKNDDDDDDKKNDEDELPPHLRSYAACTATAEDDDLDLLLASDCDDVGDDLQDDIVMHAMGIEDEKEFGRITIAEEMPPGARFGQWTELDVHRDKFESARPSFRRESLYDQTLSRLMHIQSLKSDAAAALLDDIPEHASQVSGQFDDAATSDGDVGDEDGASVGGRTSASVSVAYDPALPLLDNQFEIMLRREYGDDWIGEVDEELMAELQQECGAGQFGYAVQQRFSAHNKRENLRYQYYVYLKRKKQKLRRMLKKANRACTLDLMQLTGLKAIGEHGEEAKEVDPEEEVADSDDEARINAELETEFEKKAPPKWDVESILSTRTNHENHPTELSLRPRSKLDKQEQKDIVSSSLDIDRTNFITVDDRGFGLKEDDGKCDEGGGDGDEFAFGDFGSLSSAANGGGGAQAAQHSDGKRVVIEFGDDSGMTMEAQAREDKDGGGSESEDACVITAFSNRKGETKEEKKERKRLRKEMKQQRKLEKKANKSAFKETMKHNQKMIVTHTKSHGNALRI